jgi:hypothetical protein
VFLLGPAGLITFSHFMIVKRSDRRCWHGLPSIPALPLKTCKNRRTRRCTGCAKSRVPVTLTFLQTAGGNKQKTVFSKVRDVSQSKIGNLGGRSGGTCSRLRARYTARQVVLHLPRDIRQEFKIDGESIELISRAGKEITGCLVAV